MAVSKEDILQTISDMSVMDVVDLIEAMEEKFGVSAAAPVAAAARWSRCVVKLPRQKSRPSSMST